MKLIRYGEQGAERPGVLLKEGILDVRALAFDMEDFNADFFLRHGLDRLKGLIAEKGGHLLSPSGVRLGPPLPRPSKIICVGKNYSEHIKEFGGEIPTRPVLFAKAVSALNGPTDPVVIGPSSKTVDGEAELGVVIGRRARRVPVAEAMDTVFGYTIVNDVTDRDAQREGSQWFRGKGFDTFCPMGPWLVTRDEVADPHNLFIRQSVNGQVLQEGHSGDMLFRIPELIAFISATMTLEPGDVIATGTPSGIGSARTPPILLQPGDLMSCEIEGLGQQRNPVISEEA